MKCIEQHQGKDWALYRGDCIEVLEGVPDHSVGYSIFSPPFSSLYVYSNSPRDMGNCRSDEEFFEHFNHLIDHLLRIVQPGRLVSVHCMLLPNVKGIHGFIGLRDFRGDIIRAFQRRGFIYASEVTIWKDPVVAMQRSKALGLLYRTVRLNASMTRQGIPDYLCTFRAPGEPVERVTHDPDQYPLDTWQRIASPVWSDINPSDTLQKESARDDRDEKHIAPLQLEVIRRGIDLWSNLGDVVLSPFAGIGSEGYVSLQQNRRFLGVELKESYYRQAVQNLTNAVAQQDLFA